eukprot:jgi/Psemu1/283106/fgenesh1_pg.19_\
MILPYRKPYPIALLALIISLFAPCHVQVRAHCILSDGHIDHISWGCSPTQSPAPSDKPSSPPTDVPTESPAPSPSPSRIPSAGPSESVAPSTEPTNEPSSVPSSTPSISPTGPIIYAVVGIELTIHNVTGERRMDTSDVRYFEKKTASYVQNEIGQIPGVFRINVENILVTNQTLVVVENKDSFVAEDPYLRKRSQPEQSEADLIIIIDVVVSVVFDESGTAELDVFFQDFFDSPDKREELRATLEQENSFAKGIFIKTEVISSDALIKKGSNGTAITGAILAVVALVVGSGLVWMWIQTRRISDRPSFDIRKVCNIGTFSKSFGSDEQTTVVIEKSKRLFKINTNNESYPPERPNNVIEIDERSSTSSSQLMYIPAIMSTESNIEVPDTPGTAFAQNGFDTPSNANGFATPANATGFATPASVNGMRSSASVNGLVTPGSVMSRGGCIDSMTIGGISKFMKPELAPSEILKDIGSATPRKQKIPLPPNILGSLKSPFRREKKNDDDDEDYTSSSMFGAGVVAGENNAPASIRRRNKRTAKNGVSSDLPPTEIGGPDSPSEEATGPPDKASSEEESTHKNNDFGAVDIVDEIAYLYNTDSRDNKGPDVGSI